MFGSGTRQLRAYSERETMTRAFAGLFAAAAIIYLGFGIMAPIMPLFAGMHAANGVEIGLLFAAFFVSRALLGPFIGSLSDQVGRKTLILCGLCGYAIISLLYASVQSVWQLGLLRVIQGVFSAMIAPLIQAYVGDRTPRGYEGRYMNALYFSQSIGIAFGSLLGGAFVVSSSYETAFCVTAAFVPSRFTSS